MTRLLRRLKAVSCGGGGIRCLSTPISLAAGRPIPKSLGRHPKAELDFYVLLKAIFLLDYGIGERRFRVQ